MPKSLVQKQREAQYRLLKSACDEAKQKLLDYTELTKRHYEHINHPVLKSERYIALYNEVLYDTNTAYKLSNDYTKAQRKLFDFQQ